MEDGLRPSLVGGRNVKRALRLNKDRLDAPDDCIEESVVVILGSCWDVPRAEIEIWLQVLHFISRWPFPSHSYSCTVRSRCPTSVGSLQIFVMPWILDDR
jgi:hypothetical protein